MVTAPLRCTSFPSLPGSTRSAATLTTDPAPSERLRAVFTARASFQNSSGNETTKNNRPTSTLLIDPRRRENQDSLEVTLKLSAMAQGPLPERSSEVVMTKRDVGETIQRSCLLVKRRPDAGTIGRLGSLAR